jgi:hypothetical protein
VKLKSKAELNDEIMLKSKAKLQGNVNLKDKVEFKKLSERVKKN